MDSQRIRPPPPKPKFSVYQNPTLSAALTTRSLQPSPLSLLFLALSSLASATSLLAISFREKQIVAIFARLHVSLDAASLLAKSLQAFVSLLLLATLSALLRALSQRYTDKALLATPSKKPAGQQNLLTTRQLQLIGLKPKSAESTHKPPKSTPVSPPSAPDGLVPILRSGFSYVPSRPARAASDHHGSGGGNKTRKETVSPVTPPPPTRSVASPSTPWSKQSPGTAKGILTEAMLEKYLAGVDGKILESASRDTTTPPSKIRSFGITSPGSVVTSATASGAARSTPLRPVRMSPGSHQKYTTPPKKGEGEFPPPMSMELAVEAFESLGLYPNIEGMRDRLRQWFSSVLINPLGEKLETSHIQVMQAAAAVGISITVSPVGSEPVSTTLPVNVSPINGTKEWQPAVTVDEDGLLYQLRATLVQARDGVMPQLGGQQQLPQQNSLLPVIQQCVNAITEHQRLNTLMKGELIKGLLVHSSERAEYIVQRVRELSEGTCLKNYDYLGNGDGCDKSGKKRSSDLPTDSHLLLYLFCAFLEHPKWLLHVDPASYSSAQSSKNPLFLGVLPPKDRFPEKYIAVISGVPSIIHPGACILSVGKQSPPIFALYWDKKLQFSLQGRTALWDALLLLCHRINHAYGGIVRGVHLGSSALNILSVLDSNDES
ncbi:uncharacterized protein M6B38_366445 [Iris pallida]|uniref:Transmembrane protein 209 n=1 Tax=Iris pallida TaxID=29817 RepID=A0AAX6GFZ3_IRIPA|nr:uncharacterized protein M6B38_366445 [Iris pallida]